MFFLEPNALVTPIIDGAEMKNERDSALDKRKISEKELVKETSKMAHLFALLYYHFAEVLVGELGRDRGRELITKALKDFALERGGRMRKKALSLGWNLDDQSMRELSDLPRYTFYTDRQGTHCPFADVWKEKGALGQELGLLYCNVNDPYKAKGFNPEFRLYQYQKNRNLGDDECDSINVEYLE